MGAPGSVSMLAGRSVVGGYVYLGSLIPELEGYYVFGARSTSFVKADGSLFIASEDDWGLAGEGSICAKGERAGKKINRFLLSFGEDEDGELFWLTNRSLVLPAHPVRSIQLLGPL